MNGISSFIVFFTNNGAPNVYDLFTVFQSSDDNESGTFGYDSATFIRNCEESC
jgi:hypothetical protein